MAVQVYLQWVYTSKLDIPSEISRASDSFDLTILKLWEVADTVEVTIFRFEIIHAIFQQRDLSWKPAFMRCRRGFLRDAAVHGMAILAIRICIYDKFLYLCSSHKKPYYYSQVYTTIILHSFLSIFFVQYFK